MTDTDIVAQVQTLKRKGDYVRVEVAVTGPVGLSSSMKQRARARALMAAGVLQTSYDTILDIPQGEINRFTRVSGEREGDDVTIDAVPILGKLLQTKVYTIQVNRR